LFFLFGTERARVRNNVENREIRVRMGERKRKEGEKQKHTQKKFRNTQI
jgi:hypothetical protein